MHPDRRIPKPIDMIMGFKGIDYIVFHSAPDEEAPIRFCKDAIDDLLEYGGAVTSNGKLIPRPHVPFDGIPDGKNMLRITAAQARDDLGVQIDALGIESGTFIYVLSKNFIDYMSIKEHKALSLSLWYNNPDAEHPSDLIRLERAIGKFIERTYDSLKIGENRFPFITIARNAMLEAVLSRDTQQSQQIR